MNQKINLNLLAGSLKAFRSPANTYVKEAVLFFNPGNPTDAKTIKTAKVTKPNVATLYSLGSAGRPSTGKIFDKWRQPRFLNPLKDNAILTLHEQRNVTKDIDEIYYLGLGNLNKLVPANRSNLFRLEGLTDHFRMVGGDLVREFLRGNEEGKIKCVLDLSNITILINSLAKNHKTIKIPATHLIQALVEGFYLGSYKYTRLKSEETSAKTKSTKLLMLTVEILVTDTDREVNVKSVKHLIETAKIITNSVNRARNLVNDPPNLLNTTDFANIAREVARITKSTCRIYAKPELKRMGLNALLGVSAGSFHEAKLVVMEYRGSKSTAKKPKILLVGKGVLFDSGGLSLKPATGMIGMKMDMAGAAAVLGSFEALVRIKTTAHVVAIMPITDNMTGPDALKVGDVLKAYSGKTIEVLNTDAEGRLILSDALSFGIKTYKPDYIVDLATLTGAAMVALGTRYAGLFTTGDDWADQLLSSSRATDEPLWRMPLDDQYLGDLQSDIADLKNIGGPYGGSITAAKFLEQFVPEEYHSRWAHLDIAPTMEYTATKGYQIKGATGFGVRLLVHLVESLTKP